MTLSTRGVDGLGVARDGRTRRAVKGLLVDCFLCVLGGDCLHEAFDNGVLGLMDVFVDDLTDLGGVMSLFDA